MNFGKRARLAAMPVLVALLGGFLAGCGNFWQAPSGSSSTSYALTNSGNITVAPGATTSNTSTITVTPNSFTGTLTLSCVITTAPTNAVSPATCSLSPASVTISGTSAETATLTAATTSTTTTGAYQVTVTGVSGSVSESTTVCVEVTTSSSGSCSSGGGSSSGNFYVLNQTTNQIVALSISSGALNTIGAYTLPAPLPSAIAVAPNGQFLYVSTGSGIYLYTIGSSGALTLGNGSQAISTDLASTMQVDATNSWLVEGVTGLAELNAINVNSSTGGLATAGESEQHVALPASTVTQLAISPNDSSSCTQCYVFTSMGTGGTEIVLFNPGSANPFGAVGHINLVNSAGGDNVVAVDPSNRMFYVGETDALASATQTGGLRAFTIGAGGVTEITGSPFAIGGTGSSAILPTSNGSYLYVANSSVSGSSTGSIAGFSVTATSLTAGGSVAAGTSGRLSLAEDSTGNFVLATDFAGNPDLEAYTMSAGTLTSALTVATGTDPVGAFAIAAAP